MNQRSLKEMKSMSIPSKWASILLTYYSTLLFISILYATYLLSNINDESQSIHHFELSLAMSIVGCSIFYSRKLYKACISDEYSFEGTNSVQSAGTIFFFLLRPLFALAFAILVQILWDASVISSVKSFEEFSTTHFYLSSALGFFVGFLTGRIVNIVEENGARYIKGIT